MIECGNCKKKRSVSDFAVRSSRKSGRASRCKYCIRPQNNNRQKEYYRENREKILEREREHSLTAEGIYTELKRNIIRRGITVCGREEFVVWYNEATKFCAYCCLPEELLGIVDYMPSNRVKRLTIDRKDNDIGYTKDNMALACAKCNTIKNDILTYGEMIYIGRNFIQEKWTKQLQKKNK